MKKKYMLRVLACLLTLTTLSGCYSYKDMNRVLFFTMGAMDKKDDQFMFYGEAFKGYRGEGEKSGTEKRIVTFGKGESVGEAAEQMRNAVNYPVEYAGRKTYVLSKELSQDGLESFLDLFNRDQKPSPRMYLFVFDGEVSDLLNITMEDEQFMGLYLYEMMNSQKTALGVITNQYYQFIKNRNTGSGINVVPVIRATTVDEEVNGKGQQGGESSASSGESGGGSGSSRSESQGGSGSQGDEPTKQPYVTVDGAAVFVQNKMVTELSSRELETYKLMTLPVNSGLIDAPHPDIPDKFVGFTILNSKHKPKIAIADGRVQLNYTMNIRVVLLEAQVELSSSQETVDALKASLEESVKSQATDLLEKMKAQNVDLLDTKRMLELARLEPPSEDYLKDTDFNLDVQVTIDGLGKLRESYYG